MNTLYLALRVSTSGEGKKSTPAIKVAVAAVALSVAVMLAAIAIVLGFKKEITHKVVGFNPPIVLRTNPQISDGEYLVRLTPELKDIIEETPYVQSYTLSASMPAIFKTPTEFKGIYLRSSVKDPMQDFIASQLVSGEMPDFYKDRDRVVISKIAADQLELQTGDTLPTYFITDKVQVKPLVVSGIYNSHFTTYDDIFAFGSLPMIQELGDLETNLGTYLNIYVDDFSRLSQYAPDMRQRLDMAFNNGVVDRYYDVETALSNGANYFSWLHLLDTNVIVILALMTAVALITLISGMMILIVDKKRFIAVMKALGASNRLIRKIFVWLTLRVAFTGLIFGNAIMLTLFLLQKYYHFIHLDAESYYIDFVPVEISINSIVILNVAILIITYLMLLFPSRFVGSIKGTPAD